MTGPGYGVATKNSFLWGSKPLLTVVLSGLTYPEKVESEVALEL
jgi:hypothetical protein